MEGGLTWCAGRWEQRQRFRWEQAVRTRCRCINAALQLRLTLCTRTPARFSQYLRKKPIGCWPKLVPPIEQIMGANRSTIPLLSFFLAIPLFLQYLCVWLFLQSTIPYTGYPQINGTVSEDHLHSTWWRVIPRYCSHTSNTVDWLRLWRAHRDILIQKDASKNYS